MTNLVNIFTLTLVQTNPKIKFFWRKSQSEFKEVFYKVETFYFSITDKKIQGMNGHSNSLGIHLIVVVFSHNKLSDSTFFLPKTFSHCQQPFIKSFNINFSPFTFFIVFKYLLYLAYLIILYFEKHAFIVFV